MNLDESNLRPNNQNVFYPEKIMTILQLMYGEILEDHPMLGPNQMNIPCGAGEFASVHQYESH